MPASLPASLAAAYLKGHALGRANDEGKAIISTRWVGEVDWVGLSGAGAGAGAGGAGCLTYPQSVAQHSLTHHGLSGHDGCSLATVAWVIRQPQAGKYTQ